jgi:hypothetical protein
MRAQFNGILCAIREVCPPCNRILYCTRERTSRTSIPQGFPG